MQNIKCSIGDDGVRKSCLVMSYRQGRFVMGYRFTVEYDYSIHLKIQGKPVTLNLWNTRQQEDYLLSGFLSYPQTDIFLLLFGITKQASFRNVKDKWIPKLREYAPGIPFSWNKKDLRTDPLNIPRLYLRGEDMVGED